MKRYDVYGQFGRAVQTEHETGKWVLFEDVVGLMIAAEKARYVLADDCSTREEWNEAINALNRSLGDKEPLKMAVSNEWMKDKIDFDGEVVVEAGLPISFGLESQGHIPIIKKMILEARDWPYIGRAIGWDGATAREYYERYLNRAATPSPEAMVDSK